MPVVTPSIVSNPRSPAPGRGRRREADEPSDIALTARVTRTQAAALRDLAHQRGQSMSEVIRDLLARDHGDLGHRPTRIVEHFLPALSDQELMASLRQWAGALIMLLKRPELTEDDQVRMRAAVAHLRLGAMKIEAHLTAHMRELGSEPWE